MTRVITSIEAHQDDPNIRDVFVDHVLEATLPVSRVSQLQIEIDMQWSDDLAFQITSLHEMNQARSIAIDLITRRLWGMNELTTRLVKRGVDANIATETANQLQEDGWLDDMEFACALIREWLRKEPAGRIWLHHKLREKEVTLTIATEAIEAELGDRSEQEAANNLAGIKLSKIKTLDETTARRRVISALGRRGFTMDVASQAIRHAQGNIA